MATTAYRRRSRVTFSPSDAHPVEFVHADLVYVTEIKGARVAFIQAYYLTDEDEPTKRLKSGQVGRLEVVHPDDQNPADHLVIPLGVLTCISHVVEMKAAVRATFVIAQVG